MASAAIPLVAPTAVLVIGSVANLAAGPMEMALDRAPWLRARNGAGKTAVAPSPADPPAAAPRRNRDIPIGGLPDGPSLKAPFGKFPKHRPTKLPRGGPKPYDPASP